MSNQKKIKICAYICLYNDHEFLSEAIDSISPYVDKLFLIEGAWETSISSGANPRSNEITYSIINEKINDKIILIQSNERDETSQRQKALDICKKENCDWIISLDADEIWTEEGFKELYECLEERLDKNDFFGIKLSSYNFFNTFYQYYHGLYPRVYRNTPDAVVYNCNHVYWPGHDRNVNNYFELTSEKSKFYHYSYVRKNQDLFHLKMRFLKLENGNDLYACGYGLTEENIYSIPINDINNFTGHHPLCIQSKIISWNLTNE